MKKLIIFLFTIFLLLMGAVPISASNFFDDRFLCSEWWPDDSLGSIEINAFYSKKLYEKPLLGLNFNYNIDSNDSISLKSIYGLNTWGLPSDEYYDDYYQCSISYKHGNVDNYIDLGANLLNPFCPRIGLGKKIPLGGKTFQLDMDTTMIGYLIVYTYNKSNLRLEISPTENIHIYGGITEIIFYDYPGSPVLKTSLNSKLELDYKPFIIKIDYYKVIIAYLLSHESSLMGEIDMSIYNFSLVGRVFSTIIGSDEINTSSTYSLGLRYNF